MGCGCSTSTQRPLSPYWELSEPLCGLQTIGLTDRKLSKIVWKLSNFQEDSAGPCAPVDNSPTLRSELFSLNSTFLGVYLVVLCLSSSFLFCSNRKILSHIPLGRGYTLVAEVTNWWPTDCSYILFDLLNRKKFE